MHEGVSKQPAHQRHNMILFRRYDHYCRHVDTMRPVFEKIIVPDGASWVLLHRFLEEGIPFEWHYHPEFELTLTLNSRGQRFVGDHVADYDDGDLVLLGPNLPHTWESREVICASKPHEAVVIWLKPGWISTLCKDVPELKDVHRVLQASAWGLRFSRKTADAVLPLASSLPTLNLLERIPVLLAILALLARDPAPQVLATSSVASPTQPLEPNSPDQDRIERVLSHILRNYRRALAVEELAAVACLSTSGLSRLFKRTTGTTITGYIMRLRVGRACAMLIDDRCTVAGIATEVGYNNLANFNRQFRSVKGTVPSCFRKVYRERFQLSKRPRIVRDGPA
jgi:AraC-like DNA-binding protein